MNIVIPPDLLLRYWPPTYEDCRIYASFSCFASVFAFLMPHIFVFAQTIPPDLVVVRWLSVLRCIVWILVQTKFGRFTMFRFHYNIVGCSMGIFTRLQEFSPTKLECCLNWRGEIELVMLIKDQRLGPNRAKQDEGSDNPHKKQNSGGQYQYPEEQIILPKELLWNLLMQKRTLARNWIRIVRSVWQDLVVVWAGSEKWYLAGARPVTSTAHRKSVYRGATTKNLNQTVRDLSF